MTGRLAAVLHERRGAISQGYDVAVNHTLGVPGDDEPVPYSLTPAGEREAAGGGAAAGASAARQRICAQAAAGLAVERLRAEHEDLAAELLNGDVGPEGRAYTKAYRDEAETLCAELEGGS